MKTNESLEQLDAIPVAELSREQWIEVGMALKHEGFPCSVWDAWSRNDTRYHPGECDRLWEGFKGSSKPVTGGTIGKMAKDWGWKPGRKAIPDDHPINWDDTITDDGFEPFNALGSGGTDLVPPEDWNPVQDLITYLTLLFEPDEYIGYVTNDVWQNSDGKWVPSKGAYDRTAEQLIESLKKHSDDLGATIGDWKPEAGAWIRFNPVDGQGVKNDNVTRFKYALVESDTMPISEQDAMFRKLELPIAVLVHSGGKSLHAIVKVDADSLDEYRKRVNILYDFLEKNGVSVDKQNRNPSRLSRMPGVTRNGKKQFIVATNIGRRSWNDWMDYVEGVEDTLPDIVPFNEIENDLPEEPPELIEGILRQGHKMLISGPSKAGKSFLLMELAIAIAEGSEWIGYQCMQGKVLYINLEIDPASAANRIHDIYEKLDFEHPHMENLFIWNLRGMAVPLNELVPKLVRKTKDLHLLAVIIDPIYKVITGDENNASEMGAFCNLFDKICAEIDCSVIYCHHHSKGAQGQKKAMDRASGSGVFARDPDALLDMLELELSPDMQEEKASAWRIETTLREFAYQKPINIWWRHPIHEVDMAGELAKIKTTNESNNKWSAKKMTNKRVDDASELYKNGILNANFGEPPTITQVAECTGKSYDAVKKWVERHKETVRKTDDDKLFLIEDPNVVEEPEETE